jgi:hypothetical protein
MDCGEKSQVIVAFIYHLETQSEAENFPMMAALGDRCIGGLPLVSSEAESKLRFQAVI